jgi:hypothetical protein
VLRFPPTVHGDGDHGFVATLVGIARQRGVAGYVGDGTNRWPAVHRSDAARLARLAVEAAPAGSVLHAVGDEGVPFREIAEAMGRHLGVPTASVAPADAVEHFAHLGHFVAWTAPPPPPSPGSCSHGSRPGPACSRTSSRTTTTARRESFVDEPHRELSRCCHRCQLDPQMATATAAVEVDERP